MAGRQEQILISKKSIRKSTKPTMSEYREAVEGHYRSEADSQGLGPSSTMPDEIVREKEIAAIRALLRVFSAGKSLEALEIGCGNGHLLEILHKEFPSVVFSGIDYTDKMVELAKSRGMKKVKVSQGDVGRLAFERATFDVVISERVIINLLNADDQDRAFGEVARVLKPGGWCICIEAFQTPLANMNLARAELMLPEIKQPFHNRWFSDEEWARYLKDRFEIVSPSKIAKGELLAEPNFLSTHYFVTRVFHDLVRPDGGTLRNTHFGKFFSSVLPNHGDYAPVKLFLLRRI
jgi:ubiquinone/menaquinone biosynthesis C-methylase UbiE